MHRKSSSDGYLPTLPGIRLKTLSFGEKVSLVEFRMQAGSVLPLHSHPHEQIGYLVRGRIRFTVGGESFVAEPGDSWCVPGTVEHSAEILEDTVAVEVFCPVREDYLPAAASGR